MSEWLSERESIRQTLEAEERRLHSITTHEEAVLLDGATGQIIHSWVGDSAQVEFVRSEIEEMSGHVLTHNHPRGWHFPEQDPRRAGSSLSSTDVALLVTSGLRAIRAVSPAYIHQLRSPAKLDDSWQAAYFRRMIQPLSFDEVRF